MIIQGWNPREATITEYLITFDDGAQFKKLRGTGCGLSKFGERDWLREEDALEVRYDWWEIRSDLETLKKIGFVDAASEWEGLTYERIVFPTLSETNLFISHVCITLLS